MGNAPSRHPKAELYPYLGYGAITPTTPSCSFDLDEKDLIFRDILDQPLVQVTTIPKREKPPTSTHRRSRSWGSARSSTSTSTRRSRSTSSSRSSSRISFDSAFDAARDAWERVGIPPRRRSYHKVYENERGMIGIEWAGPAAAVVKEEEEEDIV